MVPVSYSGPSNVVKKDCPSSVFESKTSCSQKFTPNYCEKIKSNSKSSPYVACDATVPP